MSEQTSPQEAAGRPESNLVFINYIIYLAAVVFGPLSIVGVVIAYVNKTDAPLWQQSHYQFQIRTFWIGLLAGIVCAVLAMIVIGYFLVILLALWWIVRCAIGLKYANKREPHPNPVTYMW